MFLWLYRIFSMKGNLIKASKFFILFVFIVAFPFTSLFPIYAKTPTELEAEINKKKQELESLEKKLKDAQNSVLYYDSQKNAVSSDLEKVQNDLQKINAEIEANNLSNQKIDENLALKGLELQQQDLVLGEKLTDLYINDRQGIVDIVLDQGQFDGFWKDFKYHESILDTDLDNLTNLTSAISELEDTKREIERGKAVLDEENSRLTSQRDELSKQVAYLSSMASYNKNSQSGIRAQMNAVLNQVEGLNAEQRILIEQEAKLIGDAHGGTKPLVSGEYYFYGRGKADMQGHGLGFSQYGAKGGALKGMSSDQIATFYFKTSSIGTASGNIEVIGKGTMNIETYVAGLGEIPDYACGTQEQYQQRPDKYRVPNNAYWEGGCWPEEAIKAQVIVARSFALAYGGPICTTSTCQVYKGGTNKAWAASETAGKVLKSGGSIIKAYYSSDNNNGWGTATHRNPVWCWDFYGNCGTGFSWLQSVNDSAFAAKGPYTDWMWRSNSYTIEEIQSMFEWYANHGYSNSSKVRGVINKVGSFSGFTMIRDASGRVAKVEVRGNSGSETINGETFKQIFNLWVGNVKPSGEVDPIFSLTYYFVKVP
jgi:SpoIID/LytB domain protein